MKANIFTFIKIASLPLVAMMFASCATSTPYGLSKDGYFGNAYKKQENYRISTFAGNGSTGRTVAMVYSLLGAMDDCAKENNFAVVLSNPVDATTQSTYVQLNSSTYKVNGHYQTNTYATPITTTFPTYLTEYYCESEFVRLKGGSKYEESSRELVNTIKKDLMGGLLVVEVSAEESEDSELKQNDIILKMNTNRVEKMADFNKLLKKIGAGVVQVELIRDAKIMTIKTKILDAKKEYLKSYDAIVKSICNATATYSKRSKPTEQDIACLRIYKLIEVNQK